MIRLHGPLLPLEDFGSGVERPLLLFNSDFPFSELLLPIEDVERFLLQEAQIFRDFGLHRIGLDAQLFRLAPGGACTLEVFLDSAALVLDLLTRLLKRPQPFGQLGVLGGNGSFPLRELGLERRRRIAARADVPVFLPEILHEVVGPLQFGRQRLLPGCDVGEFRLEHRGSGFKVLLTHRQLV